MGLTEELEKIRPTIRTDSYPMSIGEWISLYQNGEIDIHPEFQRFFRWSESQRTLLIESILLGIPIPPIFVSQRENGVWDVIDGLQRLATIYQFVGILKDENATPIPPLILEKTKYLPSLEGKVWHDENDPSKSFDSAQRLFIKRAKLDVNIILRESSELTKFELFQRLNTGGTPLTDQEIRNCILVQINKNMYDWLRSMANYESFRNCTLLSERAIEEQYDLELALRFVVFRNIGEDELGSIGELGDFLTDNMIKLAQSRDFDYSSEQEALTQTFDILFGSTGEDCFRRYDPAKQKFLGGFLVTPFEIFAIGMGANYRNVAASRPDIRAKVVHFWTNYPQEIRAGSGIRASTRIPTTIHYGRNLFRHEN